MESTHCTAAATAGSDACGNPHGVEDDASRVLLGGVSPRRLERSSHSANPVANRSGSVAWRSCAAGDGCAFGGRGGGGLNGVHALASPDRPTGCNAYRRDMRLWSPAVSFFTTTRRSAVGRHHRFRHGGLCRVGTSGNTDSGRGVAARPEREERSAAGVVSFGGGPALAMGRRVRADHELATPAFVPDRSAYRKRRGVTEPTAFTSRTEAERVVDEEHQDRFRAVSDIDRCAVPRFARVNSLIPVPIDVSA